MPGDQRDRSKRKASSSSLLDYVVAYAKQEAVDPIVSQFKALGRGTAGALLMAVGTVLLGVGFLRALQGQFGSSADPSAGGSATPAGNAAAGKLVAGAARTANGSTPTAGFAGSRATTSAARATSSGTTSLRVVTTSTTSTGTTSTGKVAAGAGTTTTVPSTAATSTSGPTTSGVTTTAVRVLPASGSSASTTTGLVASAQPNPYGSGHPLSGNWSWVPYMGGALLCLLIAVFCVTRIVKGVSK
jgi:hypothetical protein